MLNRREALEQIANAMMEATARKAQHVKPTVLRGTATSWNGLPNRPSEKTLRKQRLASLVAGVPLGISR